MNYCSLKSPVSLSLLSSCHTVVHTSMHTHIAGHIYKHRRAFGGSRVVICRSEWQRLWSVTLLRAEVHWFLLKRLNRQSWRVNGVILHLLRHRSRAVGCERTLTFSTQFRLKVRALQRVSIFHMTPLYYTCGAAPLHLGCGNDVIKVKWSYIKNLPVNVSSCHIDHDAHVGFACSLHLLGLSSPQHTVTHEGSAAVWGLT